jgi:hypothetical protein
LSIFPTEKKKGGWGEPKEDKKEKGTEKVREIRSSN